MLPEGTICKDRQDSYPVPPIFSLMQKEGRIEEHMMYNTYNMGLGMVLAVDPADADSDGKSHRSAGEKAYIVGETVSDKRESSYAEDRSIGIRRRHQPPGHHRCDR